MRGAWQPTAEEAPTWPRVEASDKRSGTTTAGMHPNPPLQLLLAFLVILGVAEDDLTSYDSDRSPAVGGCDGGRNTIQVSDSSDAAAVRTLSGKARPEDSARAAR